MEPVKDFINRLRAPNSALYFGFFGARCAASHTKKGLVQNLICLLSLNHETFYKLGHDALHRTPKKASFRT
jgi:hypothetical protein